MLRARVAKAAALTALAAATLVVPAAAAVAAPLPGAQIALPQADSEPESPAAEGDMGWQ
ncbi:hypothetical protein QCN29_10490 [Streptomyces sp. HNM0663]|uniref:Uncharacterized protein n=1 Tax=Streptomyces chengmaiensis TaxID=3040919 RepID=A0ABT6HLR8_9ACTN|nr:hypothetical protein [Streptomyces chengmaiensis]MDH2389208.1 hypothetical protein [Streptomyces chengmaiensis]